MMTEDEAYEAAKEEFVPKIEKLRTTLLALLDQVDYTNHACGLTEMVGAVLPVEVIQMCHNTLKETDPNQK